MKNLVDQIYEAAAVPERWPAVLDAVTKHVSGAGTSLMTVDQAAPIWVTCPSIRGLAERYFNEGWAAKNDRMQKLLRDGYVGFVRDVDIYTREEVGELPVIKGFFRPAGLGWGVGLATPVPSGEILLFSVERHWERGPFPDAEMRKLEELRPHISRASLLTAKLRFERAKAAVAALGLASIPAALVRRDASVVAANDLFVGLDRQLAIGARDRLRVNVEGVGEAIEAVIERRRGVGGKRPPMSLAVPAVEDQPPLVIHLIPGEGLARDVFGGATVLILVTKIAPGAAPPAGLLRALFDLTPTEAKVAQAILGGGETRQIAQTLAMAVETVRSHVKAIFRKTGFRDRGELVRFLSGSSLD